MLFPVPVEKLDNCTTWEIVLINKSSHLEKCGPLRSWRMHLSLANARAEELGNQEMALWRISLGPECGLLLRRPRFDPKAVSVEFGLPCHAKRVLEYGIPSLEDWQRNVCLSVPYFICKEEYETQWLLETFSAKNISSEVIHNSTNLRIIWNFKMETTPQTFQCSLHNFIL
jgi:hypothetical protein